jgi:hypothetical protein
MPNISSATTITGVRLKNISPPGTPTAGFTQFYAKSDKSLHYIDDAGNDYQIGTASHTAGAAPSDAEYVVTATSSNLSAERLLAGTANQVVVTLSTGSVVLSTPQDIGTGSAVRFGTLAVGGALATASVATFNGQYLSPEVDHGTISSTAATVNLSSGNEHKMVLSANVALTFSNPNPGGRYVLVVEQDSTGGRTVSWPATVRWPAGVTPTLVATGGFRDLFTFLYTGNLYLGNASTNYST